MSTRWLTEATPGRSAGYISRMRAAAAAGQDLSGEARLVDALVDPGSRILDAGCGTGRVAAALHARGHHVLGVDSDPELLQAAQADHVGPLFLQADLATLHLPDEPFDAAVLAGNVLVYVTPGTEAQVLGRVGAHVRPDGVVVAGFATDRPWTVAHLERELPPGLRLEHRFATWDLRPWHEDAGWCVVVLRKA